MPPQRLALYAGGAFDQPFLNDDLQPFCIDTGATVSLMTEEYARQHVPHGIWAPAPPGLHVTGVAVDHVITATMTTTLTLLTRTAVPAFMTVTFCIVNTLPPGTPVLVGMDALGPNRAIIDLSQNCMTLLDQPLAPIALHYITTPLHSTL